MALLTLLRQIRSCEICAAHLPLGPRPVLQAQAGARILVAGQAPGVRVHRSGVPFDDPSGNRLRDWMGITSTEFYDPAKIALVPMGFCYPGTGRSGDLPPRPECAPQWRKRLLDELGDIRLTLVIGSYAHKFHLPGNRHRSVTATVAAWREFWPKVVPLPHPSPRNNIWLRRNPWFEAEVVPRLRNAVHSALGKSEAV